MPSASAYQLIDFGGGARLERFGDRVVDRPHPGALGERADPAAWTRADLRFDRDRGWSGPALPAGAWPFAHERLRLELRPTDAGQVGLFPEHLGTLDWLQSCVERRAASGRRLSVLHLFAYTGLATLAMAAAGAEVTHVDASRPTVAWARRNAGLSGLSDGPIRWIVDDAVEFADREVRRGRKYAGVVLDPPTYGHGPRSRPWRLEADLERLLASCAVLLERGGFVLVTAHTPGFDAGRLGSLIATTLGLPDCGCETGELEVTASDERSLELGAFARAAGTA
ncbi:MAG TPA: class I SAM-dependent methyltransferase [Candidatus Limnocylindrales bacterium]